MDLVYRSYIWNDDTKKGINKNTRLLSLSPLFRQNDSERGLFMTRDTRSNFRSFFKKSVFLRTF